MTSDDLLGVNTAQNLQEDNTDITISHVMSVKTKKVAYPLKYFCEAYLHLEMLNPNTGLACQYNFIYYNLFNYLTTLLSFYATYLIIIYHNKASTSF